MHKPTLPFSRSNETPRGAADTRQLFANRYETEHRLGIGGMAEVVLARDSALGRRVALKLLAPQLAADPVFVERFRREATAIASLNHPNVIVVYDHGVADGQPFIAMEYVPGRTLKHVIADAAPFAAGVAIRYAVQMLDGLAAAHSVGIVHRDVKPQNLIVRDDGTLKVADFGVARSADETMLTQHGSVIGTADYISPEQARGGSAGPASDLYSVGVVLFEMLTGRLPFTGDLPLAIANQHLRTPAPPVRKINPAVRADLARVVDRALSKDPAARYGSAAEMKAALTAPPAAESAPTLVAPTARIPAPAPTHVMRPHAPPVRRSTRQLTRRHVLAAVGAIVALGATTFALASGDGGGTRLVDLPKVVGMPLATAKSALQERGFDVRVGATRHADAPIGTVVGMRPAGASAVAGTPVTIIPSSGPRQVSVPAVVGFSEEAATAELERLGFVVHSTPAYAAAPAGIVVATAPPARTAAEPNSSIALTVSAGVAPTPAEPVHPGKGNGKGNGKDKQKAKAGKKRGKSEE